MLPIKLERSLVKKIWGGRSLESLDISLPDDDKYGESWEVAAHKSCVNSVSKDIINILFSNNNEELNNYKREYENLTKKNLQELLEEYKDKLVGSEVYEINKNCFPLLIKYLDINDKLSIQVHPADEYAKINENDLGKTECWYIMEASEDAELIIGLEKDITKESFIKSTKENNFQNLFNIVKVKKGDFIFIKPGVVHASIKGSIMICEVQQNSDSTYRIYDFDRLENGKKRDLHLDKAYEVIDYDYFYENRNNYFKETNDGLWERTTFVKSNYFSVEHIKVFKEMIEEKMDSFVVLSFLDGNGELYISENSYLKVKKGDTYLIPAETSYKLKGELEILKSYIENIK